MMAKVVPSTGIVAAGGMAAIGWVVANTVAGSTTARVKLTPCVASPPTALAAEPETHAPSRKVA